jgi:hypothetical protein
LSSHLIHCTAELYQTVYSHLLSRPDVAELTVEDPAEAFEDLRDKNDLLYLLNHKEFYAEAFGVGTGDGKGKIGPPADREWVEKWRKDLKMAGVSLRFESLVNKIDEWIVSAPIPPSHRDANPALTRTRRCGHAETIQIASEGAVIQVQLCVYPYLTRWLGIYAANRRY